MYPPRTHCTPIAHPRRGGASHITSCFTQALAATKGHFVIASWTCASDTSVHGTDRPNLRHRVPNTDDRRITPVECIDLNTAGVSHEAVAQLARTIQRRCQWTRRFTVISRPRGSLSLQALEPRADSHSGGFTLQRIETITRVLYRRHDTLSHPRHSTSISATLCLIE